MSNELKTISLDGFSKNVLEYEAGTNVTITTDPQNSNKRIISASPSDLSNYYTKSETDALISAIDEFNVEVVSSLPATGEERTIYLVPKSGGSSPNVRDEYMWINNAWELIGDTDVDLTNYYTKTETDNLLDDKQDTLTAGSNIQIAQDGTISATDTTYTAGTNVTITNGVISATDTTYNVATTTTDGLMSSADKSKLDGLTNYTAGQNITITNGEISATDTTYDPATTSTNGLMSSADKTKLDGITWTKAGLLSLLGYEEIQLTLTDTDGNTITKTILAEVSA